MTWTRREFLVGTVAAAAGFSTGAWASGQPSSGVSPEEALRRLKEGNERFVAGKSHHPHDSKEWRNRLTQGQDPFAVILACSDSRVPTELLFDQGFGDLFVIRVAGNILSPAVLGSVQYAAAHLRGRLLVVLGHEGCGAVTGALLPPEAQAQEMSGVREVLDAIQPGLVGLDRSLPDDQVLSHAVEMNVRASIAQVLARPEAVQLRSGTKQVVGGVYELATGRVRWLDS